MATLYWYNSSGNWSDYTNHWSNNSGNVPASPAAAAPTTTDDVVFDALSNATGYTVTFDVAPSFKNFTAGHPASGVLTLAGNQVYSIYGDFNIASGVVVTNFFGTLTFKATSGVSLITTNSTVFNINLTFNGTGGTFRLADNFSISSTSSKTLTLTAGTFDATTNSATVSITSPGAAISGAFTFYNLTIIGKENKTDLFTLYSNITVSNVLSISNGATATNRIIFYSNTLGTPRTITLGGIPSIATTDFQDITFQSTNARTIASTADNGVGNARHATSAAHGLQINSLIVIAGTTNYNGAKIVTAVSDTTHFDTADAYVSDQAGTWTFNLSAITGLSGDCGGNTGITFTTPVTTTYTMAANDNWSTVARWDTRVPLPQDTAHFGDLGTSKVLTQDMPRTGTIDFTDATWTTATTFTMSTTCAVYGSLILKTGMTLGAGTQTYTMMGRNTYTIDSAGLTLEKDVTIDCISGTYQIGAGNLTMGTGRTLTLTSGTFDLNANDASIGRFSSSGSITRVLADVATGGSITLTGNNATIWGNTVIINLTYVTFPTIISNYSGSTGTRTFALGAYTETVAPSFNIIAGTDIIAFNQSTPALGSLNMTGFGGSFSNTAGIITIWGSLTLGSGSTSTASTYALKFAATSGTKTITSNSVTLNQPITINGTGGTFQLGDNLTLGTTRTLTITNGTFTCVNGGDNYVLSAGLLAMGGGTLTLGSATHLITGTTGSIWNVTGGTLSANTSTIKLTGALTAAISFIGGGKTTYNNFWNATTENFDCTITGANTFADFKIDAGRTQKFTAATTTTMTSLTAVGTDVAGITLGSATSATHTLSDSGGTNTVSYCTISYSIAQGGATWDATDGTNTNGGNNTGWDFPSTSTGNFFAIL